VTFVQPGLTWYGGWAGMDRKECYRLTPPLSKISVPILQRHCSNIKRDLLLTLELSAISPCSVAIWLVRYDVCECLSVQAIYVTVYACWQCWQEAFNVDEQVGMQAISSTGSRPRGGSRGGGGGRPGSRRHSAACCSLDLFCYECRRRKRQQQLQQFHQ